MGRHRRIESGVLSVIKSFKCDETEKMFEGLRSKDFPYEIQTRIVRKLTAINTVKDVNDLKIPIGNRLEKLSGNREGQYSIRINDKFRICFEFYENNAYEVEVVDYH